jgi:hypothetical protein
MIGQVDTNMRPNMSTDQTTASKNALHVRAPGALTSAIRDAAARELMTPSEYTRRAVVEKLRRDGVLPTQALPAAAQLCTA